MFGSLPVLVLLLIFVVAAVVVWLAGVQLSRMTDLLDKRLHLGQALGGTILLAISTNLPELAITVSAARSGSIGVAIGNILGGIALQTVVLALLDIVAVRGGRPLTSRGTSLVPVLEGVLVIGVLTTVVIGHQLPPDLVIARLTPDTLLIAIFWLVGVWLISQGRSALPWQLKADSAGDEQGADKEKDDAADATTSLTRMVCIFGVAALATLVAGVLLERSGDALAERIGMSGVLFGATILAASTAIPEIATGIASVRQGNYELAISDIFGGNSFLPVLFLPAGLITGQAILPQAQQTDLYLVGLGILLTVIYLYGLLFRPQRRVLRMGLDSLVVVFLYALGLAGLFLVARG